MSSADFRNYVITTITNALLFPESYGDRFFVQIISTAERGYIPLTLLQGMVRDLQDVPLKYIEHCADKDPDRLQLSIDRSKVRIARQYSEDPVDDPERETDPYGIIHQQEEERKQKQQNNYDQHQQGENNNENNTTINSSKSSPICLSAANDIVHQENKQKEKQQPSKYFQHYTPSFVTKQSITAPVYFNNGKFYNDEEETSKKARQDRPRMEVPPYDKLDISALGDPRNKESLNVCWNCGSEDHSYNACPEPRDEAMINEYRKRIKKTNGPANTGRFFVELAVKNQIAMLRPGKLSLKLQKALGMDIQHPEPPYYAKMRQFGYPPGYWTSPKEREHLLSQWKNPEAWSEELFYNDTKDLRIFTDIKSYEENDSDNQDGPVKRVGTNKRVKLVHYPGLETWSDLDNRRQTITEPHLEFSYAPSYHFAHPNIALKATTNDHNDSTTRNANTILRTDPKIEYPTMQQQTLPLPGVHFEQQHQQQQQQQYQQYSSYYQYDYYSYPQYDYSYQHQQEPPQPQTQTQTQPVPQQQQQCNISKNTDLATPVSFTSNKGEELEDGEIDMDISDDDD